MASQAQIEDEMLAKRLQELEYQDHRRSTENQARDDAVFARQLSGRDMQPQPETRFSLQTGQTAMVRLHHPLTARQIGEVMYVHYVGTNTMYFELVTSRGKYMRATSSGTVEFTTNNDDKTKFLIEPVSTLGTTYLRNKNYHNKTNVSGAAGWYLSMSPQGVLSSNGAKSEYAQWALISAANSATAGPPIPPQFASPPQQYQQQQYHPPQQPPVQLHVPAPLPQPRQSSSANPEYSQLYDTHSTVNNSSGSGESGVEMQAVVASTENPMLRDLHLAAADSPSAASNVSSSGANNSSLTLGVAAVASNAPTPPPQFYQQQLQQQLQQQPHAAYQHPPPYLTQQAYSGQQRSVASSSSVVAVHFPGHDAGRDALGRFFQTAQGMQFLAQPAYADALRLHHAGVLGKILHRSDWPIVATRFKDFTRLQHPSLIPSVADSACSFQDKQGFFECGYLVARGVVTAEQVHRALRVSNYWVAKHVNMDIKIQSENIRRLKNRVELLGAVCTDCDLLALYYDSPLSHVVQQLLGEGDVANPSVVKMVMVSPSLDLPPEFPLTGSPQLQSDVQLSGDQWTIEGFDSHGAHSPFNVLVGVALTDMAMPNQGNFCVHPGSQMVLMEAYKQQAEARSALFSEDPLMHQKPDLGEPTQMLLRTGDAVVCTQRLAYLFSPNTSCGVQTMAFFRVSHVDHEVLKGPALDGIWLEFRGSDKYQGGSGDGGGTSSSSSSGASGTIDLLHMADQSASHAPTTSVIKPVENVAVEPPSSSSSSGYADPALSLFDEMMSLSSPGVVTADPLLPSQLTFEGGDSHPVAEASHVGVSSAVALDGGVHSAYTYDENHDDILVVTATAVPTSEYDNH